VSATRAPRRRRPAVPPSRTAAEARAQVRRMGLPPKAVEDILSTPGFPLDAHFLGDFARVPARAPATSLTLGRPGDVAEREADAAERDAPRGASDVRVHTGPAAASAARAVGARAFTVGRHVVFGEGAYQPGTPSGQRLLAHELAHTAQPGDGVIRRKPDAAVADAPPAPDGDAGADALAPPNADDKAAADAGKPALDAGDKLAPDAAGKPAPVKEAKAAADGAPAAKDDTSASGADAAPQEVAEPKSAADLATGNIALIDYELAEHQRWGEAADTVGAAGSTGRAKFIAGSAAGGSEFGMSALKGAAMGAGMKAAEKVAEKGAAKVAAVAVARLGGQAAKFTPLPAVGAVIGGVMSAYDLASRDWGSTGEAIGRFGKGASTYDKIANTLESVTTVIDVLSSVLNVIAGVIGAISIAMWVISVLTVGVASPLAATLSAIAVGIGLGTMALDAINALYLKRLITVFRALHTFDADADPRDVVTQGGAITSAAGAANNFLGGLAGGVAGGFAAEKGIKLAETKLSKPAPDHPTPPPASKAPEVKADPPADSPAAAADAPKTTPDTPVDAPKAPDAPVEASKTPADAPVEATKTPADAPEAPKAAESKPKPNDASWAEFDDFMKETSDSPFGDKLEAEHQKATVPPPAAPPGTKYGRSAYRRLRRLLRQEQPKPHPGMQAQHQNKWLRATRDIPNKADRMTVERISRNRMWLQNDPAGPASLLLVDPKGGPTRYTIGEAPPTKQLSLRGLEPPAPERQYQVEHKLMDNYLTERAYEKILKTDPNANHNLVTEWGGGEARWRMEGTPGQGEWGWQPQTSPPQQMPLKLPELAPKAPPRAVDPRQLDLFDRPAGPGKTEPPSGQLDLFAPKPPEPVTTPPAADDAPAAKSAATTPVADDVPAATVVPPATTPLGVGPEQPESIVPRGPSGQQGRKEDGFGDAAMRNWRAATAMNPRLATAAVVAGVPQALLAAHAAVELGKGYAKARREPVIEHVNPAYESPPGSPQQVVDLQNEMLKILEQRAAVEGVQTSAAKQESHHKANEKPVDTLQTGTGKALSAKDAHEQMVARRAAANASKQENEGKVKERLDSFPTQVAKLTTLTGPMRAVHGFTSLATILPDSPDVLVGAKRGILKLNADCKRFLDQLDGVDKTMKAQSSAQPERDKQIAADASTIQQTDAQAKASGDTLSQTKDAAARFKDDNAANKDEAGKLKTAAAATGAKLEADAQQKDTEAKSLAAELEAWAQRHRQARADALEKTKTRLEAEGYTNIEVSGL